MNEIQKLLKSMEGNKLNHTPSPFANWLSGILVSAETEQMKVKYIIRPEMTNPMQIAHGGVLASMLDEVMGMCVYVQGLNNFFASVNLHVDYLSAAPVNSEVLVMAEIKRKGSKMINIHGEIRNNAGKLLAYATSNLTETHREKK